MREFLHEVWEKFLSATKHSSVCSFQIIQHFMWNFRCNLATFLVWRWKELFLIAIFHTLLATWSMYFQKNLLSSLCLTRFQRLKRGFWWNIFNLNFIECFAQLLQWGKMIRSLKKRISLIFLWRLSFFFFWIITFINNCKKSCWKSFKSDTRWNFFQLSSSCKRRVEKS